MAKTKLRNSKRPRTRKTAIPSIPSPCYCRYGNAIVLVDGLAQVMHAQSTFDGYRAALRDLIAFYDRVLAVKGEPGHDPTGWTASEILRLAEIRLLAAK